MNTKVISIESGEKLAPHQLHVTIITGNERHKFTFTVETSIVGDRQIEGVRGDEHFLSVFRFNQNLGVEIYKLVSNIYNGQMVEFPVDIGDFYPVPQTWKPPLQEQNSAKVG